MKKILSAILMLAMLMSLVSVCFVSSVSAETVDGTKQGINYETVLNITFDSGYKGFATSGYADGSHHKPADNGYAVLVTGKGSGPSAWFANSNDVNAGASFNDVKLLNTAGDDGAGTEEALSKHFKLEPSTTYRITFKYRYRGDSASNANIEVLAAANPYIKNNTYAKRDAQLTGSGASAAVIDGVDTRNKDTLSGTSTFTGDWKTETVIVVTQPADKLTTPYLGIRASYNTTGTVAFQIDDFKVEKAVSETYVFDYKTGDETLDASSFGSHYCMCNYGKEGGSYIDADGFHFKPSNTNAFNYDKFDWNHNGLIHDLDVNYKGKNSINVDADHLYIVTVKYKVLKANGNSGIAIALKQTADHFGNSATREVAHKYFGKAVSGYQYLTGVVDAAAISGINGMSLCLTGSSSGAEFLVESVNVTVIGKDSSDVALVKTTADPYVYDVEFVKRGSAIATPHTFVYNPTNYTNETAYNISYVDPSLTTTAIDLTCGDYVYTPNGISTGNTYLESFADAERGNVVKISTTKGAGASTSTFNFNEFKPEAGKKYFITFDAKLIENNNHNGAAMGFERLYYASAAGISQSGSKTDIAGTNTNTKMSCLTDTTLTNEWKTFGWVVDAKSETGDVANRPYLLFAVPHSGTNKGDNVSTGVFLVDNFTVVEFSNVGAASAPNDAANRMASIRGALTKDNGEYQSAGLRFKGTVDAATKASASEIGFIVAPAKAAAAYGAEWYVTDDVLSGEVSAIKRACYVKSTATDVIYSVNEDGDCDYQMILTGLSTPDGKTAYNQRFAAIMYVDDAEGNRTYYNLGETSYNEMLTAYEISGAQVPVK